MNSRYQINMKQKLGSGMYGTVYTAIDTLTNELVAVKQMSKQELGLDNKIFRQEVESMRSIPYQDGENGSKYLIRYKDFYQCANFNNIVMECFKDSLDLNSYIEKKGKIHEDDALQIFYQIASGISFLHDMHIVHRDIKPSNILIRTKPKLEIKVIDFGFARLLNDEQTTSRTYVGTPMYMSPQTKLLSQYDPYANDIWSLGVLLFFMVTQHYPWKAKKSDQLEKEMLNYVAQQIQININGIPQYAKELIIDCLQVEESARIKANDLAWKTKRILQIIIEKSCQPIFKVPRFKWEQLDGYRPSMQYPFIGKEELEQLEL
ncbi:unnamed protein product [Paramecium pentaurelia]|uniref:Protein kinase domain-containing protein n=1 Tax=Paramecium pentaurelia TaxID=43138 RepID=A0A8S1WWU6_9CILI|nr:unnamed protein product [Paramecium pentaurelia]